MWENLLHGVVVNLQFEHLAVVLVGTVAGLVIGALPGLSAVSGVALLLPFTFTMDPAQGLIMLAAVYMAAEYGGSISAILINTPGTSGAACTVLDGTPLTQQGKAQDALYTSLFASTVGGAVGAIVLIFFTPTLADASLLLGPAEIFWVAAAGLALVASLSSGHTIKGMIGALIGVGITFIGQDLITGEMRFTFDDFRLVGGIPLIPSLLGLFAVANILVLLERPHEAVAPLVLRKGVIREVIGRMLKMKRLLLWSSSLGAIVGAIPGAGASISAFVAYGEAKRLSKTPEQFGKGSFEGVAAPEAANNAVVGGALVPLLALGIPGSGSAAVMFGALTVHGIIPGPRLFTERSDIVYTFMIGLALTVIAMLVVGLSTVRWSSLVVKAPRKAMVPGILVLSIVGTYGLANSLFDVYVLLAVGFTAYVLAKIDIAPVTIALGLVLGHIMEESFQQAALVGGVEYGSTWLYFANRPLAIALMVLALAVLGTGILQILRSRRQALAALPVEAAAEPGVSLRSANIILAGSLMALSAYVHVEASGFTPQAALFPRLVASALILLGGILLAINLHPKTGALRTAARPFAEVPWRHVVVILLSVLLLVIGTERLGFYACAFLFVAFVYWLLSRDIDSPARRLSVALVFAAAFTAAAYGIFSMVLGVHTPRGLLI